MFGYYFDLAIRSLRRNPALTSLMVLAIAFGVAASMTTYSIFRAVSGDPIPWKSSRLFVPQIDLWGPASRERDTEPADALSYVDAVALMRAHRGNLQSAMYEIAPTVAPPTPTPGQRAQYVGGHAVYGEFFAMTDAPFRYGHGWSANEDNARDSVVVISSRLNDKYFEGKDSTGRNLVLDDRQYRIVGVLDDWRPKPMFYDVANVTFARDDDVFIPFTHAIDRQIDSAGNYTCMSAPSGSGFAGTLNGDCVWIAFMVQLDTAAEVADYRRFLDGYAGEQHTAGRFGWGANNRLRNLPEWMDFNRVAPPDTKVSLLVALGLLLVCMINTVGLMLAKFLRRSIEIGVRRALGASRAQIALQFTVEAGVLGLGGGLLGLLLTGLGVLAMRAVLPKDIAAMAHMDLSLLFLTLLVAVFATVLAGLYPTLRASYVRPAMQLKSS